MKKIACVGILVADVIVQPTSGYPGKGELLPVDSITVHNGGNAMTASINLTKLGCSASIIGMVGKDMFGTFLKQKFDEYGIPTKGLKVNDKVQTSASVLLVDESGERSFYHCTGTDAVFSYDDIDFSVVEEADIVFVTGTFLLDTFDGEDTMRFLKKCKEMGKTTFLDVCFDAKGKWGEIIDMSMPYIDVFMPSIDEAKMIAKTEDVEKMADIFIEKGVKSVVIKCGSKGCYLKKDSEDKGSFYPAYKVENVVDTTGAGDSFCSGFISAYARGESLDVCAKVGNATGAQNVTEKGATSGIKTYEETIEFIKERSVK